MTEIFAGSAIIVGVILLLTVGLLLARRLLVPEGALEVTVNDSRTIEARRGDKLLHVLQGAGIAIPAGCGGSGTCGLCRVTVTGPGGGEPIATEKGILSAAERRANLRLACQTSLRGPVNVAIAGDTLEAESLTCTVISSRMMAPLIREIVMELPEGHEFHYRAGGFMQVIAPAYSVDFAGLDVPDEFRETWQIAGWNTLKAGSARPVTRAYSVACRPEDAARGRAVFNIRLAVPPAGSEGEIPPGIVSSYLFSLKPGDTIGLSGPYGEFHVQPSERDMVFIGGGVGMAPLRAMIHEQIGKGTKRNMWFFYGARSVADLFYTGEFEAMDEGLGNFSWTPALSDPAPGDRWTGATGFIHEIVRERMKRHRAPEDCEYYLCGPPVMISAVLRTLDQLGVERHTIFSDDFGA